ncbi:hypothetical protein ACI3E5_06035 [Candidatus Enterococcus avicola]
MEEKSKKWILSLTGLFGGLVLSWIGNYIYTATNMEGGFDSIFTSIGLFFSNYPYSYAVRVNELPFFVRYGSAIGAAIIGSLSNIIVSLLKSKFRDFWVYFALSFYFLIGLGFILYSVPISSQYERVSKERNNIEIIKPVISESEYNLLVSEYYQIKNKDNFEDLRNKIKRTAEDNDLSLQ